MSIFGYPGGMTIDIYDDLAKSTAIRHILVRHEQGAVHAADGYARASGKTGVCLVTSGPGATNTVTGIASAYMDSIPVVVLTGQVPTRLIGNDAFQEVDIVGITRPCTKHNYLVKDVEDLARILKEAFYIARSGRPGPGARGSPEGRDPGEHPLQERPGDQAPVLQPHLRAEHEAAPQGREADQGEQDAHGADRGRRHPLRRLRKSSATFARKIQAPVASTLMGLGAFPASDPLWLGMIGMHGTYSANMASSECDLMIAVGVRFDDRVTGKVEDFAPHAKIIHIDIDPTSIRKNIPVAVPIVGDCKITLGKLNDLLEKEDLGEHGKAVAPWLERIAGVEGDQAAQL